MEFNKFLIS